MALRITLNGTTLDAQPGTTVLQAALAADVYIPALCAHPDLPPQRDVPPVAAIFHGTRCIEHDPAAEGAGGCGICAVDVDGEGRVPACATKVRDGMTVVSRSPALDAFRRERLSAILAHHPHACLTCAMREGCTREPCSMSVPVPERCCPLLGRCELQAVAAYVGIDPSTTRYVPAGAARITGDPLFDRDPELCIGCGRCVRACAGRGVGALGWVRDSAGRRWVGTVALTLAESGCRFCGSCVEVCPTGALADRDVKPAERLSVLVPCRAACPAGSDVPRYVGLVADGRLEEAAAVVAERAPLVEVLGHVCFHPCESACRHNQVNGAPISICAVKREAGAATATAWTSRLSRPASTGKKVGVVGAGPAGLMAAFTLRLLGHDVSVFEAGPIVGGMLVQGIPPFRLPREVVARDTAALIFAGIAVHTNTSVGHSGLPLGALLDMHDAIVVATGAPLSMMLGADGEERREVRPGLSVLADASAGRLDRATYDGQAVVVIGGGNVAVDCARTALRLGASHVGVVCLEQPHEMPAFAHEVRAAIEEGIRFHHGWGVRSFAGNGRLKHVRLKKCRLLFDADGRFAPIYDEAATESVPADAAIVAIGQRADRSILPRSLDGIFLAGDLATGPRSVVEAIASGREAALSADKYLGGTGTLTVSLSNASRSAVLGRSEGFADRPRLEPPPIGAPGRPTLCDVRPGLGPERARAEADRCLRCDLRFAYRSPVLPPKAESRLPMEAASVERVPEVEGVLRFYAADGAVLAIVGTANGRQELAGHIGDGGHAATFDFEACPMYTQRQNELLSQFVEVHGRMPPGVGGDDEIDDLF